MPETLIWQANSLNLQELIIKRIMKKIKIGISQINNSFSGAHYLPYAAGVLQTYFQKYSKSKDKYKFLVPLFKRIKVSDAVDKFKNADIVGFSLYSWNEQLSLAIAKELKNQNKKIKIIFGGPQVPDNSKEFLESHKFIDFVVNGEGEKAFLNLVESLEENKMSDVAGISFFNKSGEFVMNPKPSRIGHLDDIPSPYLSGAFDELMKRYPNDEWLILWETNRGCPFKCTFCDWGSATASKLNKFELERLEAEIDWFSKNKIEFIFCCDANFGILKRDIDIAKYASMKKLSTGYPKALSVQNTKNATERAYITQKILADSGLNKGVTLSMQSLDEHTLLNIKRDNISLNTYEDLQSRFTKEGVPTYSDLILGLPGETFKSFTEGVSRLIENGQHNRIQFNNLSILPNSEMGDENYQKKFQMETVDTNILNMHGSFAQDDFGVPEKQKLVISTSSMPKDEWVNTRAFSWMTAFLHFNKIIQIPIIIFNHLTGENYNNIFEYFTSVNKKDYPEIFKIKEHFLKAAKIIQNGGPEYHFSKKWLNIWWPHDEFMLIKLYEDKSISNFYKDCQSLLTSKLLENDTSLSKYKSLIEQSIHLNYEMLKLPKRTNNIEISCDFNILEFYHSVLEGEKITLKKSKKKYLIVRKDDQWLDDIDWAKKVVWFANKKGAYLYGSKALEKYYASHY